MSPPGPVLVVDDDAAIVRLISLELEFSGFKTVWAKSAKEARRLAVDSRPSAILLDALLPDGSGDDVLHELKALCAAPVMILSAMGSDPGELRTIIPGADDYLSKPFDPPELTRKVARLVTGAETTAGT